MRLEYKTPSSRLEAPDTYLSLGFITEFLRCWGSWDCWGCWGGLRRKSSPPTSPDGQAASYFIIREHERINTPRGVAQ